MSAVLHTACNATGEDSSRERGSALLIALMVALVLVFLGMGLLLQTSLGLEAAGTDRWVVKALYAADAGVNLEIEMLRLGDVGAPGAIRLADDVLPSAWNPSGAALTGGEFNVRITNFCETQPPTPVIQEINGVQVVSEFPKFQTRHFHFRSEAERTVGGLTGLTRAAVEVDISSWSFHEDQFVAVEQCY